MAPTYSTNESNSHGLVPRPAPRVLSGCPRAAFTLVELLVVITILAILASIMLFALSGAQETAKEVRTRGTIAKLNALIMQKYESYRTRRVPLNVQDVANQKGYPATAQGWARARLDMLRELMRMEMPDSFADVQDDTITKAKDPAGNITQMQRPAVNQSYKKTLDAAKARNSAVYGSTVEQAMCLYLIITKACDDPDVLEQFASNEIATDPDIGLSYFVDGWGHPIYFLRWAPGFHSPLQPWDLLASSPTMPSAPEPFDPFDPLRTYMPTSATTNDIFKDNMTGGAPYVHPPLYPLIYSPGADGQYEVEVASGHKYSTLNNDPYTWTASEKSSKIIIGAWKDQNMDSVDGRVDNLTNHDIETR